MSTYTDLHNKVKETINVDFHNRITPQKAKFLNEENEYWGTFKGTMAVENVTIKGGTIEDATIKSSILVDPMISSSQGVLDLGQMKAELDDISCSVLPEIRSDINEISGRVLSADRALDEVKADVKFLSNVISTDISNAIDAETAARKAADEEIINQLCETSCDLENQLYLTSCELSTRIAEEAKTRHDDDLKIRDELVLCTNVFQKEIDDETRSRNNADKNLSIDYVARDVELSNKLSDKLTHDKHFELVPVNPWKVPYQLKDYASNSLIETFPDIYLLLDKDGQTSEYPVAKIEEAEYTEDGKLTSFKLQTFDAIPTVVKPQYVYNFPNAAGTYIVDTGIGAYQIIFNQETNVFTIASPEAGIFYYGDLKNPEVKQVLQVHGPKVVDGKLTNNVIRFKADTCLSNFAIKDFQVLDGRLDEDVIDAGISAHIKYNSVLQTLTLSDDISTRDYIELIDETDSTSAVQGKLYKDELVWDEDESVKECGLKFAAGKIYDGSYKLNKDNSFKVEVLCQPWTYVTFYDNTVEVNKEAIWYIYDLKGDDGTKIGSVIPSTTYAKLSETNLFTQLSVSISDIEHIKLNGEYILNRQLDNSYAGTFDLSGETGEIASTAEFSYNPTTAKLTITRTYVAGGTYIHEIQLDPEVWNDTKVIKTQFFKSKKLFNDKASALFDKTEDLTKKYVVDLKLNDPIPTGESENYLLKMPEENFTWVEIPKKSDIPEFSNIGQQFIFRGIFKSYEGDDRKAYIKFVDPQATVEHPTRFFYLDHEIPFAEVYANKHFTLKFNEIAPQKYVIEDLDYTEFNKRTDELRDALSIEIDTRTAETGFLSGAISDLDEKVELSVKNLQDQVIANDNDIEFLSNEVSSNTEKIAGLRYDVDDINERIRGHLNYKGQVPVDDNLLTCISAAVFAKYYNEGKSSQEIKDMTLSAGFYYMISCDPTVGKHLWLEGIEVEDRDLIIFHTDVKVPEADKTKADIIDAMEKDTFRLSADNMISGHNYFDGKQDIVYLSAKTEVADDLTATNLYTKNLTVDTLISVAALGVNALSAYKAELTSSHTKDNKNDNLSADNAVIDNLSVGEADIWIENVLTSSVKELSVSKADVVDAGISNLTAANASIDAGTLSIDGSKTLNDLSVDLQNQISGNDKDITFLSDCLSIEIEHQKKGVTYFGTLTAGYEQHELTSFLMENFHDEDYKFRVGFQYRIASKITLDREYVGENDYLLFNSDCILKELTWNNVDVIRDAYTESEELTRRLNELSDHTISLELSVDGLSAEIDRLSSEISVNIDNLSTALSGDIDRLSAALSTEIDNLSTALSNDVDSLSIRLSTDIDALSTSLSTTVDNHVAHLENEISSNDDYLSNEISTLQKHYDRTFDKDHSLLSGPDVKVDVLTLTDEENTTKSYYLTYKYGTMVLVQR